MRALLVCHQTRCRLARFTQSVNIEMRMEVWLGHETRSLPDDCPEGASVKLAMTRNSEGLAPSTDGALKLHVTTALGNDGETEALKDGDHLVA